MQITFQFWPPRLKITLEGCRDADRERSCLSKVSYGHEETARQAVARQPHRDLAVYPCRYCAGWHLHTVY